jgi:hypothetical protein
MLPLWTDDRLSWWRVLAMGVILIGTASTMTAQTGIVPNCALCNNPQAWIDLFGPEWAEFWRELICAGLFCPV